jgi:hypothetical protein
MAKLPKVVSERKREIKEVPPPRNLSFIYFPGKTDEDMLKKYLATYLKGRGVKKNEK